MYIRLGHLRKFRDLDRALLICGDSEGLEQLARLLRELEHPAAAPMEVHALPFADARGGLKLTAIPVGEELGVRASSADPSCLEFVWHHSSQGWLEAAEKVERVASGGRPAHNYLTAIGPEDATVMVSIGEYDLAWWKAHG